MDGPSSSAGPSSVKLVKLQAPYDTLRERGGGDSMCELESDLPLFFYKLVIITCIQEKTSGAFHTRKVHGLYIDVINDSEIDHYLPQH